MSASFRKDLAFVLTSCAFLLMTACGKKAALPASTEQATPAPPPSSLEEPPGAANGIKLPLDLKLDTGDLDEMAKGAPSARSS